MKNLWPLYCLFILLSCEDPLEIDLPQGPSRLVVEGVITDLQTRQEVKLSFTNDFDSEERTPKISGAEVTVIDSGGEIHSFSESVEPGLYRSDSLFAGIEGRAYRLLITLPEGAEYQSSFEVLSPVPPIDNLSFAPNSDNENAFTISAFSSDFPGIRNFYRWRVYKDEVQLGSLADIFLRSDRLFDGNPFNVVFEGFVFSRNDVCRVEQFSLSEEAFDYFRLLQAQASDAEGSTSLAPTEVTGNIFNSDNPDEPVLGFFYATSIKESVITIDE